MDRFVYSCLFESINLEIQTAFQVSRPISPFQIILGERVNDLDKVLKAKRNKFHVQTVVRSLSPGQTKRKAGRRKERGSNHSASQNYFSEHAMKRPRNKNVEK